MSFFLTSTRMAQRGGAKMGSGNHIMEIAISVAGIFGFLISTVLAIREFFLDSVYTSQVIQCSQRTIAARLTAPTNAESVFA